jgi:tetratricopeptide (TPR) repeat protein
VSVLEFLGEILPWPASKRSEDVQTCKSRLILQADALHAAIGADPCWDHVLAHACDRGAAEWEHWLLTKEHATPGERDLTAHSALTLARRSGDWALVGKILGTWQTIGSHHKRFYRDAVKAYERHRPAFDQEWGDVAALAGALNERPDPDSARRLLSLTESYADRGGAGFVLHARADAHQALGDHLSSQHAEFAACIANPLEWRLAWMWFVRSAMVREPVALSAETKRRVLAWYDQSVIVHAGALFLANARQAKDGPPSEALIASALALPRSPDNVAELAFVFENIAWALVSRGDLPRASAILAEALKFVPTHQGLLDLREATARFLSESRFERSPCIAADSKAILVSLDELFAKRVASDLLLAA